MRGTRVCALLMALIASPAPSSAEGISTPRTLPAFQHAEGAPDCRAPPGLRRVLAFAQDNDRQFMQGVAAGLAAAARDRGLEFEILRAANDPELMVTQVREARAQAVGALVAAPINAASLSPAIKELIRSGAYVGSIVAPPATSILNAPQYRTGQVLAEAARSYIEKSLRGKARVVLLTHDSNQFLAQRFVAMRHVFAQMPGVTLVADISPVTVNKQGGYETMKKIMIAHTHIDVVLGADTVVLGALAAMREAGRTNRLQFFGGIDGEPEALAELMKGQEYRATISLASPVFAYAMGHHAADWLEGRPVPQAMDILPTSLTRDNIAQYEADSRDPAAVWRDAARRDRYLTMYGRICYDTRDQFLDFPWSSERRPAQP